MTTVRERFERHYIPEPNSGCFIWTGSIDASGYGRFALGGRNWKANRIAWLLAHGDPQNLHVLHRCDNRLCVNASHLFLGTNADNVADKVRKGRAPGFPGEQNREAKLTAEAVREIRAMRGRAGQKVLAEQFGVSVSVVSRVQLGNAWRSI